VSNRPTDFSLPEAKEKYDRQDFQAIVDYIRALEKAVFQRHQHLEVFSPEDVGGRQPFLILRSPDGTRWSITVDDLGVISATDIGDLGL
jgi:hypothetical protein